MLFVMTPVVMLGSPRTHPDFDLRRKRADKSLQLSVLLSRSGQGGKVDERVVSIAAHTTS